MTLRSLVVRLAAASLVTLAVPISAQAGELDDLTALAQETINVMTNFLSPPPGPLTSNNQQNFNLIRDCLGYSATSGVRDCRDAEIAGTGLVCPPVTPTPQLNAACNASAWKRSSRSLSALTQQIIRWDSDFTVDIKVADTRTSLGAHTHTFTGARQSCAAQFVTQHDVFRLVVAVYQGASGTITLPNDPRDAGTLGAAEVRAKDMSGLVITGPIKAVCTKETHPTPRSCNAEDAEREGRPDPPREEPRDVRGGGTEQ